MNAFLARRLGVLAALVMAACSPSSMTSPGADASADATCGPCPLWTVRCGGSCIDPTVSPNNCGVCGVQCDTAREICQGGVCVAASRCTTVDAGSLGAAADAGRGADAARTDAGGTDATRTDAAHAGDGGDGGDGVGATTEASGAGLRGEYFGRDDLTDLRFVRLDPAIDFDWTTAGVVASYPRENFSVRWTGSLQAPTAGTYTFHVVADDGARVWLDGAPVVDAWGTGAPVDTTFTQSMQAGHALSVRFEYQQLQDETAVHLQWSHDGSAMSTVPASAFQPARGDAWTCASGSCCAVTGGALCCPSGMQCVEDPAFHGCCPVGETCTPVPACVSRP